MKYTNYWTDELCKNNTSKTMLNLIFISAPLLNNNKLTNILSLQEINASVDQSNARVKSSHASFCVTLHFTTVHTQ